MYVQHMKIGELYRPISSAIWNQVKNTNYGFKTLLEKTPDNITHIKLWKGYLTKNQKLDNKHPVMMYLGHTHDDWLIDGTRKHHWFLVEGKEVVLVGSSFKLLERVHGQ
tara:strand:- start:204 stop:530 length:327 start_codon:yes stop_codon:yes gene_type:complete